MKKELRSTGKLKQYSLSQILTYLKEQKKTGVLTFEDKSVKKDIYIKSGNVVFASSNKDTDSLGEMLISRGKITPEQHDKFAELLKGDDKRQGAILVELGYITPKNLFLEITHQIKEIIFSLFLWEDGTFSFKESSPSTEIIKLNISLENLIREGIERKESKEKEEASLFIKKVDGLCENIDGLSYYDILDVKMNTSLSEIKKAYLRAARDFHPDKHHGPPDSSLKDRLTTLFTFLNKAYDTLSDETKREKYDSVLLKKTKEMSPDSETIKAEKQFERGVAELKKGNSWGAEGFLRWATKLNPKKANYWAHLALALSKIPRRGKEAEEAMLKAIELEHHNANYYIQLGIIYVEAHMNKRAVHQFETALTWDPTNKKAQKELEKLKGKK